MIIIRESQNPIEDEVEDVDTREIIKNNFVTSFIALILFILFAIWIQQDMLNSLWILSQDTEFSYYYYKSSSTLVGTILASFVTSLYNIIFSYVYRVIRFIMLLIIVSIIFYCFVYIIVNLFVQTKIKYGYLLLTNILSFFITVMIAYFSMPDMLTLMDGVINVIDMLINGGFTYSFNLIIDFWHDLYLPILLCIFLMFIVNTILQLSIRHIGAKKTEVKI
jgi:hypothetical protein